MEAWRTPGRARALGSFASSARSTRCRVFSRYRSKRELVVPTLPLGLGPGVRDDALLGQALDALLRFPENRSAFLHELDAFLEGADRFLEREVAALQVTDQLLEPRHPGLERDLPRGFRFLPLHGVSLPVTSTSVTRAPARASRNWTWIASPGRSSAPRFRSVPPPSLQTSA